MTIGRESLREALLRILERNPAPSDWRKNSAGRIVRYIDWRKRRRA